jgi:MarR family
MTKRTDKKGRSKGSLGSFVALEHFVLDCEAWQSLSLCARQAYIEIARVYSGTNNGSLALSARALSDRLHVSKATASRALKDLGERGFVEVSKHGGFNLKTGDRRATEWRLTRFKCDKTGQLPTKAFMDWKPAEIHFTVSPEGHSGFTRGTQQPVAAPKSDFVGTTRNRNGVSDTQSGFTTGPHIYSSHRPVAPHSPAKAGAANYGASVPTSPLHSQNPVATNTPTHGPESFTTITGQPLRSLFEIELSVPDALHSGLSWTSAFNANPLNASLAKLGRNIKRTGQSPPTIHKAA